MRFKMTAAIAAAAMTLAPVAASANPASMLSVSSSVQADDASEGGGGMNTATAIGVVFALLAIGIGVASGGSDSPKSP